MTTIDLARDGEKLVVKTPAEHPPLDDYKLDDVDRGLELLTFEDVQTDKQPVGDKIGQSVYTTSDGLDGDGDGVQGRQGHLGAIRGQGKDKTKGEADKLNARLAGWTYQLGAWKQKALVPSLDDLKAPPPEKPADQPAGRSTQAVSDREYPARPIVGIGIVVHQGRHRSAGAPRQAAQCRRVDTAGRCAGGRRDQPSRRRAANCWRRPGLEVDSLHFAATVDNIRRDCSRARALPLHDHRLRHPLGCWRAGGRDRCHRSDVGEAGCARTSTTCGARRTG